MKSTLNRTAAEKFEAMLPDVTSILHWQFQKLDADAREEAVAEAVATAWQDWVRMVARGLESQVSAHTLAWYAGKRVREGRHVGSRQSRTDVLHSTGADRRARGYWVSEIAALDAGPRVNPADLAITRLDFEAWMIQLKPRQRETAALLAAGFTVAETARMMGTTIFAVYNIRSRLEMNWNQFQGVGG